MLAVTVNKCCSGVDSMDQMAQVLLRTPEPPQEPVFEIVQIRF